MNTALIAIGIVCALGILTNLFLQLRKPAALTPQADLSKDVARLEKDLQNARQELAENSGKSKRLFIELEQAKAKLDASERERDNLQKTLTKAEAKREQQEKEHAGGLEKIDAAERALKEERQRVLESEVKAKQFAEEERDRLWNDHENAVISALTDLCKLPHLQFKSYSNNSLPDDFDGSLKPDFLIDFLDQYVIFDAKASKAESLQTYIDDAVKKTAEKVRKNSKIYPHIFLVVPTEAIGELKKLIYAKDEYYFYIVSREALAPILASLKRISTYELAETLDPQKRENIINMIAELAAHISYRNAHEILLTKMGAVTLERVSQIDPEIAGDVEQKKAEKKISQLAPSEIKRLATSLSEQNLEMQQLTSPRAAIRKKHLESVEDVMVQKLL